jgi:hypothetical protein
MFLEYVKGVVSFKEEGGVKRGDKRNEPARGVADFA